MTIDSYRDLRVWQAAREIVKDLYNATSCFPSREQFGLTAQIRRAATSIPSNIAEGHARESTKEYLHHLSFALGSLAELETQLILACDLTYLGPRELESLLERTDSIGKMLRALQRSLRSKLRAQRQATP